MPSRNYIGNMKKLLLICLLMPACQGNAEREIHETITKQVKESLNDPDSYESVSFVKTPYTRLDSANDAISQANKELAKNAEKLASNTNAKYQEQILIAGDMIRNRIQKTMPLIAINDTVKVGDIYTHRYRAKNGFGGTITTETRFVKLPGQEIKAVD